MDFMVKVAFKYNPELVDWIKQSAVGSRWNPSEKFWDVPDSAIDALKAKAEELGVDLKITETAAAETIGRPLERAQYAGGAGQISSAPRASGTLQTREGDIRLRKSKDGRFVIISITLIADTQDVEQLISGALPSVKFRILPPRPPQTSQDREP